jgi:hypothetical protein
LSTRAAEPGCFDLAFRAAYPIDEPGEVALEDYTRTLLRARAAEGLRSDDDPSMMRGVHVCGLGAPPTPVLVTDIEDFARSLAASRSGGGLGWS